MVLSITASCPGPEAVKQPHIITLPPPYLTVGMMFFFWNAITFTRDETNLPKTSTFVSSVHRIFSQKSCFSSRWFLPNVWWAFVIFGQRWFSPGNSAMHAIFAECLSYGWVMNIDLNWGKWSLQFFRCCYGFFCDLLDELLLRSWVISVIQPFLGSLTTVSRFLHLWIMLLTVVCCCPKALKMALIFYRLIDVYYL